MNHVIQMVLVIMLVAVLLGVAGCRGKKDEQPVSEGRLTYWKGFDSGYMCVTTNR
jgi:hypothetical protein